MRTLAIDFGAVRVGLAISDPGGTFVAPLEVLPNDGRLLDSIAAVIAEQGVQQLVLGLPLNMDNSAGPAARGVIAFGKLLREKTGLDPRFVDERLSSFDAEQQLIEQKRAGRKMTRQMKKQRLDAVAAASFLREFIDGRLRAIDVNRLWK